jgi:hypothetical protein
MNVILSDEFIKILKRELKNTKKSIYVISAFCKESIIKFIQENILSDVNDKKLLVRFTLNDILTKVTDFTIYNYCKTHSWELYVLFNLHAKTYLFDKTRGIIGSSNATNKGTGFADISNIEISTFGEIEAADIAKIEKIFSTAIKINDKIFSYMIEDIKKYDILKSTETPAWNMEIRKLLNDEITSLFSYELPEMKYSDDAINLKYEFLDLNISLQKEELREAFLNSKIYKWLIQVLSNEPREGIYFGKLTVRLHDALIDDPPKYRREVKDYLINLISWVKNLAAAEITIDVPNHSHRLKLK